MNDKREQETVAGALGAATETLKEAGLETPGLEAEFLLTYLLDIKRHALFMTPDRPLSKEQSTLFKTQIARRAEGEPPQYITGRTEFMGHDIRVTPATLIPRPETEQLVEEAIKLVTEKGNDGAAEVQILDLCTGSGCIAVSVACALMSAHIVATDLCEEALAVAKENAIATGVADRVEFLSGDLFGALTSPSSTRLFTSGCFDLILSNPPYIASGELDDLQPEVAEHEPRSALDGGPDGLDAIRRIVKEAPAYLKPGGRLIMEIGYEEAKAVKELLKSSGRFIGFEIKKDLNGIERMVVAVIADR
ncbi:MAG: peptide chain release factor N(5)-glutamine methyltransferase [Proteobacteria bacterium]|nr:peptide chain release factor N(5)-glutamine methyltransferase [Pseudomonadota bacterium]